MTKCKDCGDVLGTNTLCRRCVKIADGMSESQFEYELESAQRTKERDERREKEERLQRAAPRLLETAIEVMKVASGGFAQPNLPPAYARLQAAIWEAIGYPESKIRPVSGRPIQD